MTVFVNPNGPLTNRPISKDNKRRNTRSQECKKNDMQKHRPKFLDLNQHPTVCLVSLHQSRVYKPCF